MMTAIALIVAAVGLLVVEVVALRNPDDEWPTITAVFRALPRWAIALIWFSIGLLTGHFYWP